MRLNVLKRTVEERLWARMFKVYNHHATILQMSQYYKTKEQEYDLAKFTEEERKHLEWLLREYHRAMSWVSLCNRTSRPTVTLAQKINGEQWQKHPLYNIQLDLLANAGIKNGEFKGDLSDMLIEK